MRLGAGDLLILLLVGLVGPSVGFGVLSDPGLGWHLRVPDVVFADGFVTADPFSDPPGRYWIANQWLGELPFWAGWKLAGWNGVAAVSLGLILLTYRLLFGWLRADGVAWPVAMGLGLLACAAGYVGWLARPTMFTTLFAAVVARVVVRFCEGELSFRRLLWLPPLFAVWVNCHGGFVAGFAILGLATMVEALAGDRRRAGVLALIGAGCGLATLANPYGWRVYPWVFSLLGDPFFMNLNQEWLSPDFHAPGAGRLELLVLLLVGLLAVSRYRPSLVVLALTLFWLHQTLQGRRFSPIWVLVVTPLVGRLAAGLPFAGPAVPGAGVAQSSGTAGPTADRFHRLVEEWRPLWAKELAGGWLGPVLVVAGLAGWAAFAPPLTPDAPAVPEPGLRELLNQWQPGERVFHSPNHGGYLTLFGWPAFRTTLDDRNEVHGQKRYEEYLATVATAAGWEDRLAEGGYVWVVAERGTALADRLAERPDRWRAVSSDGEVTLFRRR